MLKNNTQSLVWCHDKKKGWFYEIASLFSVIVHLKHEHNCETHFNSRENTNKKRKGILVNIKETHHEHFLIFYKITYIQSTFQPT